MLLFLFIFTLWKGENWWYLSWQSVVIISGTFSFVLPSRLRVPAVQERGAGDGQPLQILLLLSHPCHHHPHLCSCHCCHPHLQPGDWPASPNPPAFVTPLPSSTSSSLLLSLLSSSSSAWWWPAPPNPLLLSHHPHHHCSRHHQFYSHPHPCDGKPLKILLLLSDHGHIFLLVTLYFIQICCLYKISPKAILQIIISILLLATPFNIFCFCHSMTIITSS